MYSLLKYKRICLAILALVVLGAAIYWSSYSPNPVNTPEPNIDKVVSTAYGFPVHLIYVDEPEKGIVFFLTDNTDSSNTKNYAKQIAEQSYYVVVVDTTQLLTLPAGAQSQCVNIAERLLNIQSDLSQKFDLDTDYLPILMGKDQGAAAVYIALAQEDTRRFHAAISLDFTGQLRNSNRLCSENKFVETDVNGIRKLMAVEHLPTSWYLFQEDNKTQFQAVQNFAKNITNAKITLYQKTDQPVIPELIQILQWLDPRLSDQFSSDEGDGDLPLIEVMSDQDKQSDTLAILLTGDGGWAEIDKGIAAALSVKGIPTVAFDSLSYFWNKKTPDEAAADIEKVMDQYLEQWNKKRVVLIGYSFGADVLPFIADQISVESRQNIVLIALLGVGETAAFEFHLSSWMDDDKSSDRLPLLPEIKKMSWANSICIYGVSDTEANCLSLAQYGVKSISMSGDHHFDEDYNEIVQHIVDNLGTNQGN